MDTYNLNLMQQILNENELASHGLEDVVRGGKAEMILSHKTFIMVKLQIDLNLRSSGYKTEQ